MEFQEQLKQEAIELGLCKEWTEGWGIPNQDELCQKFIKGMDFCIKHNWPQIDVVKRNMDNEIMQRNGIYMCHGSSKNQRYVVAMGDACVKVHTSEPCEVTALHKSVVRISVIGRTLCYINARHDCKIIVENKSPLSRIVVSYWGGEIIGREFIDKINIKNK